jgi:multiple sugar transport system ATP-binding protein
MTLGHRVAVMRPVSVKRPYNLQQVAAPTELFNNPVNLFVAGFIGSPAMNMVYGELTKDGDRITVAFGGKTLTVGQEAVDAHPGLEDYLGKKVVVGIRPGAFEHARSTDSDPGRTITVTTDVNENLGSESYVHFFIDSPPVLTPDIEELLADSGLDPDSLGDRTKFTARTTADVVVPDGSTVDLTVETGKLHFFDIVTSDKIGVSSRVVADAGTLTDAESGGGGIESAGTDAG